MSWERLLMDAGLSEREVNTVMVLSDSPNMKASEIAKKIATTRLDAYNSLEKLQRIGIVTSTADRPMRFSSPPINEVVSHLIEINKEQLSRMEESYQNLIAGKETTSFKGESQLDEPKFAVLKERVHILKRVEKMAEDAEESLTLVLGKFGILQLCRNPALAEVNSAAERGIVIRVLAQLDRRTTRFYNELNDMIEVKHSDDLDAQGAVVDSSEVIQYLTMEDNPVGRGKEDAALFVESETFAESQLNLIDAIWEEAIPFETASKRFTEEKIVDPLKLTLDSMSFLEKIREVLEINDNLPETDTPFNPDAFMASGLEVNEARRTLETGGVQSLAAFGIDLTSLLRQVGNRIGQELAFSLKDIDGNIEFLNEMMDWWEYAGLGKLSYDLDPDFHIKVELSNQSKDSDLLPLWALDDGIIEGALNEKYNSESGVLIRRVESQDDDEFCRYNLIMSQ